MRGTFWRVANEQIRPATNEHSLGAEIVNRYLADLRIDLKRSRGHRKFVDVEKEGTPRCPEDGENSDEAAPDEEDREQQQDTAAGGASNLDADLAADMTRERSNTLSEPGAGPYTPEQSSTQSAGNLDLIPPRLYPFESVRSGPYTNGPNYYQCWLL
jgi:hypothetical protein